MFMGDMSKEQGFESFAHSFLKQMVKKEVIYEPLLEARKQMQEYMGKS